MKYVCMRIFLLDIIYKLTLIAIAGDSAATY